MNTDLIVPFAVDVLLKSSAILVFTRLTLQIWGDAPRRRNAAAFGAWPLR